MHFVTYKRRGFTLIEMIVSLGVFSIVVTIATGALLMLIAGNQRYQQDQNLMSNLSFALDSMTREIRTGNYYYCITQASDLVGYDQEGLGTATNDCDTVRPGAQFRGLSFKEGGNSITGASATRILYYYDPNEKKLFRKVGNRGKESLVSDTLDVVDADFVVSDADQLLGAGDDNQPVVTIYLEVIPKGTDDLARTYAVQTTITQRSLDL